MAFYDNEFTAPPLWTGGPSPGGFYPMRAQGRQAAAADPRQHTLQPTVTGTSVLGLKFDGGVIIAADTLGSYGSLARFRNLSRLQRVGDFTIVGASGDISDFIDIKSILETTEIEMAEANHALMPRAVYSMLTRIMYNMRSKMKPYWNTLVVAGIDDGEPFLGTTDKLGVAFTEESIATGYGAYIALPLMRDALEKNGGKLSQAQAMEVMEKCLKVLFYRDARSVNKYEIAVITAAGVTISEPKAMETDWSIANMVNGYE